MKGNKLFISLFLLFTLIFPQAFSEMNSDKERGVIIDETYCRTSCSDQEGNTYTVALGGKVWLDEHDPEYLYCAGQINEYIYKNNQLMTDPISVLDISFDDKAGNFGGYIYYTPSNEKAQEEAAQTTRGRGFLSAFLNVLQDSSLLWKLLYAGHVTVSQNENIITTQYVHAINPCPIGTYVEMLAQCDSVGADFDEVALGCNVYQEGELVTGDSSYSNYGYAANRRGSYYTYYLDCSSSDQHNSPYYGCNKIQTYDKSHNQDVHE